MTPVVVRVIVEGQTEEGFIKRVVAPGLRERQIFLKPLLMRTSRDAAGGAVTFERLKLNARNLLREQPPQVVTTFIDLYKLDSSFPEHAEARSLQDPRQKATRLERAMHAPIVALAQALPERFIPHIQPYEFEGLLFSDVGVLCSTEAAWAGANIQLSQVRGSFATPEHINDHWDTRPSKRLEVLHSPRYRKPLHGPAVAGAIGIQRICAECLHFNGWLDTLRSLAN